MRRHDRLDDYPAKADGRDDEWLLVKMNDDGADRRRKPVKSPPESILSARTNEDLEGDE